MSTTNATKNKTSEKRALEISVDTHEKFEHIVDTKFTSSTDLCGAISTLFSSVYADFEGCNFEFLQNTSIPIVNLFFNHRKSNSELPLACSKDVEEGNTQNSTLRNIRSWETRKLNGDKFFLTAEGKDGLEPFILENRNFYNNKGEINWGKLVTEVSDNSQGYMQGMTQSFTKVSCLDPVKIVELIYGKVDEDGIKWIYGIRPLRSIPTVNTFGQNITPSMMIAIERVCEPEVLKLSQRMGLSVASGLNIIR